MPKIKIRDSSVPPNLRGWLLVNEHGLPRYWATVWCALDGAAFQESTLSGHLSAIEKFYLAVAIQTTENCLDQLISNLEFDKLEKV